jgi:hypothetical protein
LCLGTVGVDPTTTITYPGNLFETIVYDAYDRPGEN